MSAPIPGMCCENCLYFEPTDERFGECRRHAPRPNAPNYIPKMEAGGKINTDMHWPKVFNAMWCGQFAAHKKTHKKETSPPAKKTVIARPSTPPQGDEVLKLKPEEPEPTEKKIPSIKDVITE